jgi:hypothetical protein
LIAERYQNLFPGETHTYTDTCNHLSPGSKKKLAALIQYNDQNPTQQELKDITDLLCSLQNTGNPYDKALVEVAKRTFADSKGPIANALNQLG